MEARRKAVRRDAPPNEHELSTKLPQSRFYQQRRVHHDDFPSRNPILEQLPRHPFTDRSMRNAIKHFPLRLGGECDPAQRGTVERPVRKEDGRTEVRDERAQRGLARSHDFARE